jgi:DNA-binding MarR family transcriptional regulator
VDDPPHRLRRRTTWLLNRTAQRTVRAVHAHTGAGVARNRFPVLAALEELGGLRQADLGRRVGIDRSDVVAVLDLLEAEGLVRRTPDPEDRRCNVVVVTERGVAELGELEAGLDRVADEVLAPLTREERVELDRLVAHHGI